MKTKTSELIGPALDWAVAKCQGGNIVVAYGCGAIRGVGVEFVNPNGTSGTYILRGFLKTEAAIDNADGFNSAFGRYAKVYKPSTNWAQGGPIIEREFIELRNQTNFSGGWEARKWIDERQDYLIIGKRGAYCNTPLIAAMRCYVASKLGDEVEIPEGLI